MVFRVGVWSSQSVWVPCHWTSNWWRGRQQTEPDTPGRKKSYQKVHAIWAKSGLRGEYLSCLSPPIDREQTWGPLSDSGRTALARGSQVGSTHSGPHSGWNASCTANLWIGCLYCSINELTTHSNPPTFIIWGSFLTDTDALLWGGI